MHMADALISPAVGGAMFAATAGTYTYSVRKIKTELDNKKIPLMGVMGAFVFAAQMINFSIPGTGSSGHIGGGLLLSIILGPYAAFLTMASILLIQALFFADGGLLAYGANVFNLGFYTCFIAYPLIYKFLTKRNNSTKRIFIASTAAAVFGLQSGAFSIVIETLLSGRSELPFTTFLLLMQPIHLVIGIVEGLLTGAVISFVLKASPEVIEKAEKGEALGNISVKKVFASTIIAIFLIGGIFSWFASSNPDGLEWSISKVTGQTELKTQDSIYSELSQIQSKVAVFPDYSFKESKETQKEEKNLAEITPSIVNVGTSVSGILGGIVTLIIAGGTGVIISIFKNWKEKMPIR
ncbi:cobalamin biosynthesis protein CbiM [Clostridium chromiireducens]|uniref:Cobalamin biosynthesis protein CbiM n=1 Tax=Clostridium chromiireducens TaxID=225345 RepID=A0A964RPD7_9CLOT|nr:energy-coupling factor ABC transporter permease [Clostridium chromiireducens]MVX65175.1 cobalamin biosynthesis protein CbiM [Clostridium chromiireducens]